MYNGESTSYVFGSFVIVMLVHGVYGSSIFCNIFHNIQKFAT